MGFILEEGKYKNFVKKLFDYLNINYKENYNLSMLYTKGAYDFSISDKNGQSVGVEIKDNIYGQYYQDNLFTNSERSSIYLNRENLREVIIISFSISPFVKSIIMEPDFSSESILLKRKSNIITISNILFLIKDNEELKGELDNILPFSIVGIYPEITTILDDFINIKDTEKGSKTSDGELIEPIVIPKNEELKTKLNGIKSGKRFSKQFEETMEEILKYIFGDCFYDWSSQEASSGGMYRFDLIAKIKDQEGIWKSIQSYFNSRYVVFEFKNYSEKIKQTQIYTTEKYLYQKALRNVAIIISKEGLDKNAEKACSGAIREQGKLILTLKKEDLVKMLDLRPIDPVGSLKYMEKIFDEFLINLEK